MDESSKPAERVDIEFNAEKLHLEVYLTTSQSKALLGIVTIDEVKLLIAERLVKGLVPFQISPPINYAVSKTDV